MEFNVGGTFCALAVSGSPVDLGGDFFLIDGTTHNKVVAVDATTGALK